MQPGTRWTALVVISAIGLFPLAPTADADAVSALRCERTINKELAKFIKIKSRLLKKCKEGAVKKAVPASPVNCPLTAEEDKIDAAAAKMKAKIARSCGGANNICNPADTGKDSDEPLSDIGWNIGTCPDLQGEGCTNAIADCDDIGTCVECIGHEAVNKATELYYDLLTAAEFGTRSDLNKCQVAIGKETVKYLQARSKLLQRCWDSVLRAKDGFASPPGCPDTDPARTLAKLARAEQKKIAKICKACGAGGDADGDNVCDLPLQGFSAAAIGFEPDCPSVTVPGSGMACEGTVTTLGDLIACIDCFTDFQMACTTALAVPGATAYPAECDPP